MIFIVIITQIYSDLVRKVNIWLFPALTSTRCFDAIRVAPDWVKIWEVSIGVYWFLLVSVLGRRRRGQGSPIVARDGGSGDRGHCTSPGPVNP